MDERTPRDRPAPDELIEVPIGPEWTDETPARDFRRLEVQRSSAVSLDATHGWWLTLPRKCMILVLHGPNRGAFVIQGNKRLMKNLRGQGRGAKRKVDFQHVLLLREAVESLNKAGCHRVDAFLAFHAPKGRGTGSAASIARRLQQDWDEIWQYAVEELPSDDRPKFPSPRLLPNSLLETSRDERSLVLISASMVECLAPSELRDLPPDRAAAWNLIGFDAT